MSTSAGNMRTLNVTDPSGNIWVMTMVDASARQAIDEAKNLQFDEDFFTSEVTDSGSTVSVGLNGVPIGVESPLKFVQDNAQGIVLGSDAHTYSTAETKIGTWTDGKDVCRIVTTALNNGSCNNWYSVADATGISLVIYAVGISSVDGQGHEFAFYPEVRIDSGYVQFWYDTAYVNAGDTIILEYVKSST